MMRFVSRPNPCHAAFQASVPFLHARLLLCRPIRRGDEFVVRLVRCSATSTVNVPAKSEIPNRSALVIVESPAKAATIQRILSTDQYKVRSCVGHVRDLPTTPKQIPSKYKKEPWARLGVDVANGFQPLYVLAEGKRKIIAELKTILHDVDELILATDEDREGEAISWHLLELLKPSVPVRRAVFHEITPDAIHRGIATTRDVDMRLVEAQETRRILDRLAGFTMSPLLWKKIAYGLSAGRVQSVALSLIVQRELERLRFHPARYCDANAEFHFQDVPTIFATLVSIFGCRVARGADFDPDTGKLFREASSSSLGAVPPKIPKISSASRSVVVLSKEDIQILLNGIGSARVTSVQKSRSTRRPPVPFITSTLQQECGNKLGMSAGRTMKAAQGLYENGYITYMRTDNPSLSEQAVSAARACVETRYGPEYLLTAEDAKLLQPKKPKSAQAAHEAIRPAGSSFRSPDDVQLESEDERAVYELIYRRTLASQMTRAVYDTTSMTIEANLQPDAALALRGAQDTSNPSNAEFRATGRIVVFPGFVRAYEESTDDNPSDMSVVESTPSSRILPNVIEGQELTFKRGQVAEHSTKPRPRYTDASLVKELEVRGVGRPSTYASIIEKLVERTYVFRGKSISDSRPDVAPRALVPSLTAFAVDKLLSVHFPSFVDARFTSEMEDALDMIAAGEANGKTYLAKYYLGDDGLAAVVQRNEQEIDNFAFRKLKLPNRACNSTQTEQSADHDPGIVEMEDGFARSESSREGSPSTRSDIDWAQVDVLVGPHGPYVEYNGKVVTSLPRTTLADELSPVHLGKVMERARDPVLGTCPESGVPVLLKSSKFGAYVQLGRDEDVSTGEKPKRQGLLPGMDIGDVTLALALELLQLPRLLGTHPVTGLEVRASHGPFGPYICHEGQVPKYVYLKKEELFTIELDAALDMLREAEDRRLQREQERLKKKQGKAVAEETLCTGADEVTHEILTSPRRRTRKSSMVKAPAGGQRKRTSNS